MLDKHELPGVIVRLRRPWAGGGHALTAERAFVRNYQTDTSTPAPNASLGERAETPGTRSSPLSPRLHQDHLALLSDVLHKICKAYICLERPRRRIITHNLRTSCRLAERYVINHRPTTTPWRLGYSPQKPHRSAKTLQALQDSKVLPHSYLRARCLLDCTASGESG